MMAEKFSHSFSQQQQKMRINEFKWDYGSALSEPTPRALFGLMVAVFRSSSAVRPRPGWQRNVIYFHFDATDAATQIQRSVILTFELKCKFWRMCARCAPRVGSSAGRMPSPRLTTSYGKWATYPPIYSMRYNRKYTCAYAPSTYDHINQYTSTYVLLFAYVRMCDVSSGT